MGQKKGSPEKQSDSHDQLIDQLVELIDLAKTCGDPNTVSLLKMALLREVETLMARSRT